MDIYDVIEAFRRQRILLAVGLVVVLGVIAVTMFELSDGSVVARLAPRYQATAQMVVVAEGVEELTNPGLTSSEFVDVAAVYADLLSTEKAIEDIEEATGVNIEGMTVTTGSRSPVIKVDIEAATAENATAAANGAFSWLTNRLLAGGTVAAIDRALETEVGADSNQVIVLSEPTFASVDPEAWIEFRGPDGNGFATPLNVLESGTIFDSEVGDRDRITITVGPETGLPEDTVQILTPLFDAGPKPPLEILLRRGAVVFGAEGTARINSAAISINWLTVQADEAAAVTVMLLDADPIPVQIGQRRGVIIAAGALFAGILGLLVVALMRDTWQQRKQFEQPLAPVLVAPAAVEVLPTAVSTDDAPEDDEAPADDGEPAAQPWQYRHATEDN